MALYKTVIIIINAPGL